MGFARVLVARAGRTLAVPRRIQKEFMEDFGDDDEGCRMAGMVRVRAVDVIIEAAAIGNIDAHRILVPLIEDESKVRQSNLVLQAHYSSSASNRPRCVVSQTWNIKDGMDHQLATCDAEEKATREVKKDSATSVIDVLIEYISSSKDDLRSFKLLPTGRRSSNSQAAESHHFG
eukprot:607155-Hanusia_phi.AAC.9